MKPAHCSVTRANLSTKPARQRPRIAPRTVLKMVPLGDQTSAKFWYLLSAFEDLSQTDVH